jgi:hypothetical protein
MPGPFDTFVLLGILAAGVGAVLLGYQAGLHIFFIEAGD